MIDLKNSLTIFICCHLIFLKVGFSEAETRIVNGRPTTIDKVPFLIQLYKREKLHCGGTLVSDRFVVTAAHCVHNTPTDWYTVVGGATRSIEVGIRSKVANISIHPHYDPETLHADVAVLKLECPIRGPSVEPACFCNRSFKNGDPVQLFGWGRLLEHLDFKPIKLQTVEVNVISEHICRKQHPTKITNTMFCAAALEKDACKGDSGGPALVNGKFCGIVSQGLHCGQENSPSVYTSIPQVLPFIASIML